MKFLYIILFFISISFIACKTQNIQTISSVEYHNKEEIAAVKVIKLKDRAGY